jgi:opacity protein-like surface antigen
VSFTTRLRPRPLLAALCFAALAGFLTRSSPASAEFFADLYVGAAYTPNSDVTFVIRLPTGAADHTSHDVKWDTSGTIGARFGYWFESVPWFGIGLDVFTFNADIPTQTVPTTILGVTAPARLGAIDVSVTAIAFDMVRLRYPFLVSPQFPRGRLQAYATAGPALFQTRVKNVGNSELTTGSATDTSSGVKAGAGLYWQLGKEVAIFGEYRYTHYSAEPVLQSALSPLPVPFQFDLDTHHLVAGVSFRF